MFEFCDFMWELGSRKDSGLRGKTGVLNWERLAPVKIFTMHGRILWRRVRIPTYPGKTFIGHKQDPIHFKLKFMIRALRALVDNLF